MNDDFILAIADISGYTKFMKLHAMSMAHAQDIVGELLLEISRAARPEFKLCKTEGDAAFFYAPVSIGDARIPEFFAAMRAAFHESRERISRDTVCACDACGQASALRVKFVVHAGPALLRKSFGVMDLTGINVIVAHRMLKVSVPASEYVLITEDSFNRIMSGVSQARPLQDDLEGIGPCRFRYWDFSAAPGQAPALERRKSSLMRKWMISMKRTWRTLPMILGLKPSCQNFRNLSSKDARQEEKR